MTIGRFAGFYRWCEYLAFGRALERRRFAFLDRLSGARRILILGEGDGRAVAHLLTVAPNAQIDVVELSGEMIELARRRVGGSERIRFVQQNALDASWPSDHYDAILTFFFLDCFSEVEARGLIGRLAKALLPGGLWLMSDFAVPNGGWRQRHAQAWLWIMYRFFAIVTSLRTCALPPVDRLLGEAGLGLSEVQEERFGMIRSELWRKSVIGSR